MSDEDLKQHLTAMESRLNAGILDMATRVMHEMGTRFDEVKTRLVSIDERLKVQAGLVQGGARSMARFSAFSESSEERWIALVGRVAALEKKLEDGAGKA